MVPSKGGTRRKYGGTTTRHGFRKGDFVQAEQPRRTYRGWVSGDTERQVSVSDVNWKRLGQFSAKKTWLIQRSTGLLMQSDRVRYLTQPNTPSICWRISPNKTRRTLTGRVLCVSKGN
jgi:hypothetical protein